MDIRLLGRLEVVADGTALPLGGLRQRAVLAVLCLHANQVVSADRLVDDVWAGDPPASVATTLRGYLSHLRRALSDTSVRIETRRPGYLLAVDPWTIDVVRFEHLMDEGRVALEAGNGPVAAGHLRDALALWRGPALADFAYEPFAEPTIARLEEQRLVAVEHRIEADLRSGGSAELVGELRELVAEHPLREGFRGQLMRALHRSGRRAAALRVYQEGRRRLIDELGLDPSPTLQALEQAILLDDLAESEQPPAPAAPAGGNLPAPLTSFVGRGPEIVEVTGLLGDHRLVTLTGTGGSGKTRLAVEIGSTVAPRRRDGVWMVELAPVTAADLVADAFAAALGVTRVPETPVLDGVVGVLANADAVLVVDNCEHVRAEVSQVLFTVLQRCPNVRVLATSREPLGIPGEVLWKVPSLQVPDDAAGRAVETAIGFDAVRLFADRAATNAPDFRLTADNVGHVSEITRRLDGIPLAIELAAARLQALSVAQVASLLDDRFRLLASDSAVILPRHRTLRAVIDFSYDLLTEPERVLFGRLSVFAGEFDLELAEDVCAHGGLDRAGVLDVLARLVARSLVARVEADGDQARYRMLETIRAYAAERLQESGEEPAVRHAHAAVCTARATEAAGHAFGAEVHWLDSVERMIDDHRCALEWLIGRDDGDDALRLAVALWPFWNERIYFEEGRHWLDRCLALPSDDRAVRAAGLAAAADFAFWTDDFDAAEAACAEGLQLALEAGEHRTRARLLLTAGSVARERDDLARARALGEESRRLAARCDDAAGEAEALHLLAMVTADGGDLPEAEALASESRSLADRAGDLANAAGVVGTLGSLALARGDLPRAASLFEECLAAFRARGQQWGEARAVGRLGAVAMAQGDPRRAYELGADSLRIYERLRSNEGIAESLLVMSDACRMSDDLDEAALLADAALERCRERGFSGQLMWALLAAGAVALRRGDLDDADALLTEAHGLFERGQTRHAAAALLLLGVTRSRRGEAAQASDLCRQSLDLFQEAGDQRGVARSLLGLAEAALAGDEPLAALRYLSAARSTGRVNELRTVDHEVADYLDLLGRVRALVPADRFDEVWASASEPEAEPAFPGADQGSEAAGRRPSR